MQVSSQLEHLGVPSQSAVAMFSQIVDSQAVMLATNDFYQSATIMMLASIGVIWFIKRPKGPLKQVTGH
jgi:DHA2 family multidrug resistance protein